METVNLKREEREELLEIGSLSQNQHQHDNPTVTLYESPAQHRLYYIEDDCVDTMEYLLDDEEAAEARKNPEEFLKNLIDEMIGSGDDVVLSRLERYRWGLRNVADDEVGDDFVGQCMIVREGTYYGYNPINCVEDDKGFTIIFDDFATAKKWIAEHTTRIYHLSHNEAGAPDYTIVAA